MKHSIKSAGSYRWLLLLVIAGTALGIGINVNDSTIVKQAVLYIFTAGLVANAVSRAFQQKNVEISFSAIHILFACYIAMSALSMFRATNLNLSLGSLLQLTCAFIIFLSSYESSASQEALSKINSAFLLTIAVSCAIELVQQYVLIPSNMTEVMSARTAMSTFGNASYFAGYLALLFPLVASQFLLSKKISLRILLTLLFMTMLFMLVKTESRSAWVAVLVSSFMFVVMYFKTTRMRFITIGIALVMVVLVTLLFPDIIGRRVNAIFQASPTSSVMRRAVFYEGAWKAFLASPVIGNGIGNFQVFLPKFRSPSYWMTRSEDVVPHAHNEFLEILSETGILGFVVFVVLLVFFFRYTWKSLKTLVEPQRTQLIGYVCGIISVLVDNLASVNLRTIPVAVGFWMLIASSLRTMNVQSRKLNISLPAKVTSLRWLPYTALVLWLMWYIPKFINQYKAEYHVLEGELLCFRDRFTEAIPNFQEALRCVPDHPLAQFSLAASLVSINRYGEAREHASHVLKDYPWYPKAHLLLAISSFELGDTNVGLEELEEEMRLADAPQTYYYAGYFAYRLHQKEKEYRMLTMLLQKNTESKMNDFAVQAIERLSDVCKEQTTKKECGECLSKLRKAFPTDVNVLASVAVCYEKFGFGREAKETASQAIVFQTDSSVRAKLEQILQNHTP